MLLIIKSQEREIMSMSATDKNKNKIIQTLVENVKNLGFENYELEESEMTL